MRPPTKRMCATRRANLHEKTRSLGNTGSTNLGFSGLKSKAIEANSAAVEPSTAPSSREGQPEGLRFAGHPSCGLCELVDDGWGARIDVVCDPRAR